MPEGIEPDALYSSDDVARILGVKAATVRQWIRSGRLEARKLGKRYWTSGSSLLAFVPSDSSPGNKTVKLDVAKSVLAIARGMDKDQIAYWAEVAGVDLEGSEMTFMQAMEEAARECPEEALVGLVSILLSYKPKDRQGRSGTA